MPFALAAAVTARLEAGPGPYSFDCNVPGGMYDERNVHVPDGVFAVNGTAQFLSLQTDARWTPLAAVELAGASEGSVIGITAFVNPYQPGKIQVAIRNGLQRLGGRTPAVFATISFTNAAIPFGITFDKPGHLLVTVAHLKRTVSLPTSVAFARVRILCSTAHVRFSNVIITDLRR